MGDIDDTLWINKHVGCRIKINDDNFRNGCEGKIIGTALGTWALVLLDERTQVSLKDYVTSYGDKIVVLTSQSLPDVSNYWIVKPKHITLLTPPKPLKPITLYPHKCKACGQPSRKTKMMTLCSNGKCSANRKGLKQWLSKSAIPTNATWSSSYKGENVYGYIICPNCKGIANDYFGTGKEAYCKCCDFKWEHKLRDGSKLSIGQPGNGGFTLEYTQGRGWVNFNMSEIKVL